MFHCSVLKNSAQIDRAVRTSLQLIDFIEPNYALKNACMSAPNFCLLIGFEM